MINKIKEIIKHYRVHGTLQPEVAAHLGIAPGTLNSILNTKGYYENRFQPKKRLELEKKINEVLQTISKTV